MRNLSLRERYFGPRESNKEDEQAARDELNARKMRMRTFLDHPYMPDFRARLDQWLEQHEPAPASHEQMLFQAGVRKGLLLVREHLAHIAKESKGEQNE